MAKPNGFPDPYFNGNVATFEKAYILSSHPMDGSEKEGRESKNSTMVKFFAVVEQRGVGVIGQFSPFINAEEKTGIGCARYFSETVGETMKFSPYEVKNDGTTTLGAFSNPNNHVVYSLIITNESTKKVTNCDVLMFNWPTGSAPSDETAALEMLDYFAIHEVECFTAV
ncbi:hypothetical protein CRE_24444 [Caenorhabditis remanei]|uniref:Uncharacterized protein n=1 Tax=Caenorhabditis remanei TaxID=31234 RepID=E3MG21_CAERE|nr:hypothetical protein CRE_24444 [Caenorhabditis remanei]